MRMPLSWRGTAFPPPLEQAMKVIMASHPKYNDNSTPYWLTSYQLRLLRTKVVEGAPSISISSSPSQQFGFELRQPATESAWLPWGTVQQGRLVPMKVFKAVRQPRRWPTLPRGDCGLCLTYSMALPTLPHLLITKAGLALPRWRMLMNLLKSSSITSTGVPPYTGASNTRTFYFVEDIVEADDVKRQLSQARSRLFKATDQSGQAVVIHHRPQRVASAHEQFVSIQRSLLASPNAIDSNYNILSDCRFNTQLTVGECFDSSAVASTSNDLKDENAQFMSNGHHFPSIEEQAQLITYLRNKFPDRKERSRWPPYWITIDDASILLPFRPLPDARDFTLSCGALNSPTEPGVILTCAYGKVVRWYHSSSFPVPLSATPELAAKPLSQGSHYLADPTTGTMVHGTVDAQGGLSIIASASMAPALSAGRTNGFTGSEGWDAIQSAYTDSIAFEVILPNMRSYLSKGLCRPMPILNVRDGNDMSIDMTPESLLAIRSFCYSHRVYTAVWGTREDYASVGLFLLEGGPLGVHVDLHDTLHSSEDSATVELFPSFMCTNVVEAWRRGYSRREFIQAYDGQLSRFAFGNQRGQGAQEAVQ